MAVDTPARIVVIGAGPIGLEAALYARFLGYDVAIYERGRVADHVEHWGDATMSTPWRENVTSLGLAALRAQDTLWQPPAGDTLLTNREWIAQYLVPLSHTDLLADHLFERTEVLAVTRLPVGNNQASGEEEDQEEEDRDDGPGEPWFEVRVRDAAGHERTDKAHVIIDASGVTEAGTREGNGQSPSGDDHYILGAKSYIGRADFTVSIGHQQIRDLFTIIGDRADLDLYKSVARAEL